MESIQFIRLTALRFNSGDCIIGEFDFYVRVKDISSFEEATSKGGVKHSLLFTGKDGESFTCKQSIDEIAKQLIA